MEPADVVEELDRFIILLQQHGTKALNARDLVDCNDIARELASHATSLHDIAKEMPVATVQLRNSRDEMKLALKFLKKNILKHYKLEWPRDVDPEPELQRVKLWLAKLHLTGEVEQLKEIAQRRCWRRPTGPPQPAVPTEARPDDNEAGPIKAAPILNDTLLGILKALEGKSMRVDALAHIVTGGETTRLYRDGMKTVLEKEGLIILDRRIGWYRPDKPPADRILPVSKLSAKK